MKNYIAAYPVRFQLCFKLGHIEDFKVCEVEARSEGVYDLVEVSFDQEVLDKLKLRPHVAQVHQDVCYGR